MDGPLTIFRLLISESAAKVWRFIGGGMAFKQAFPRFPGISRHIPSYPEISRHTHTRRHKKSTRKLILMLNENYLAVVYLT